MTEVWKEKSRSCIMSSFCCFFFYALPTARHRYRSSESIRV